jgi:hypothetical protein
MVSIDQVKHNRITARVLLAASVLGIAGLVGLSAASADSIKNSGPFSTNVISNVHYNSVTKFNETEVLATSSNTQTAVSGSANVSGNTVGGNATSGSASNKNTSTNVVVVVNK